jgi:hypothetical protein
MSNGSAGIDNVKCDRGMDAIQLRQWWTSADSDVGPMVGDTEISLDAAGAIRLAALVLEGTAPAACRNNGWEHYQAKVAALAEWLTDAGIQRESLWFDDYNEAWATAVNAELAVTRALDHLRR